MADNDESRNSRQSIIIFIEARNRWGNE
jgi:hypothetical protein